MTLNYDAVVIGSSMGGLRALKTILSTLPAEFPLPIMIVQHQLDEADDFLPNYLNKLCPLDVKNPFPGEKIEPSTVYLSPPGYHLLVEEEHTLSLSADLPVNFSIPSIDVLFESAAEVYEERVIGVVLTGSSADGAKGISAIKAKKGLSIVQDPATAEADVMPKAAIAATKIDHITPLGEISDLLRSICDA